MGDFFAALMNPDIPFLRYAFLAGILSSAAFGIMGSLVVVKRISSIAGAISHSVLGGIGLALYCQTRLGMTWFNPLLGAFLAAILSALIIGFTTLYAREREDTIIGALWAVGMAAGLLFFSRTPSSVDPMSYLFGNIILISKTDLVLIALLDVVVIGAGLLFFHQLEASCFDEDFTAVRGLNPRFYTFLILILTAITVVLMVTIVGIVMVIALLTLPAAIGNIFTKRLGPLMVLTGILTMIFSSAGITVSYLLDFPSGPTIIILTGLFYLITFLARPLLKKVQHRKG